MGHIHVIHENQQWSKPLFDALRAQGLPFRDRHMGSGLLDLGAAPEPGLYYNRMSASSHTRGHRYAPEYTTATLAWLEAHGARVVNGSSAIALELSKVLQYQCLARHGVRTPATVAALGRTAIIEASRRFAGPFITKHNRAGKGLGVKLFHGTDELLEYLDGEAFQPSVDGVTLIQQYVHSPTSHITRVEFVGGRFVYAVRVDTSGGFELCPADVCDIGGLACPADDAPSIGPEKFSIISDFEHPLVSRYEALMAQQGIEVAAMEFIVDEHGVDYTYDINTNTNYNAAAERRAGIHAMQRLASYLGQELDRTRAAA